MQNITPTHYVGRQVSRSADGARGEIIGLAFEDSLGLHFEVELINGDPIQKVEVDKILDYYTIIV